MKTSTTDKLLTDLGYSLTAEFLPYRNDRMLRWRVTLRHEDKEVWQGDYSAGEGHCPAYQANLPRYEKRQLLEAELSTGFEHYWAESINRPMLRLTAIPNSDRRQRRPILPHLADVVSCLLTDMDAGEETFNDFCGSFGYDSDSRRAYDIWLACVDCAAKMRRLGAERIAQLRELLKDY